ncbi:hypothetical protein MycrhDRAFT_5277 [Mycolicibacterium rhodesiae JS60]|nr:hypothetical protein MycrhDRAFT_5277 [Mycolicibacterium rhodesiae JS60]
MTIELACEAGIGCAAERIFSVITDLARPGPQLDARPQGVLIDPAGPPHAGLRLSVTARRVCGFVRDAPVAAYQTAHWIVERSSVGVMHAEVRFRLHSTHGRRQIDYSNASSRISCCSTACTFELPDDGADIARREIRLIPVSFSGNNSGSVRPNVGHAPWLAGSS